MVIKRCHKNSCCQEIEKHGENWMLQMTETSKECKLTGIKRTMMFISQVSDVGSQEAIGFYHILHTNNHLFPAIKISYLDAARKH